MGRTRKAHPGGAHRGQARARRFRSTPIRRRPRARRRGRRPRWPPPAGRLLSRRPPRGSHGRVLLSWSEPAPPSSPPTLAVRVRGNEPPIHISKEPLVGIVTATEAVPDPLGTRNSPEAPQPDGRRLSA